jgi:hypothetical protein
VRICDRDFEGRQRKSTAKLPHGVVNGCSRSSQPEETKALSAATWLLVKMDDEEADARRNPVSTRPESVLSGRTIEEIAKQAETEEEKAND